MGRDGADRARWGRMGQDGMGRIGTGLCDVDLAKLRMGMMGDNGTMAAKGKEGGVGR